ncbi:hypothetical protein P261_00672 [Lachnospiraceae bacterium TWA4]|nr:hypothetical protein P261_00672 [Lachnospiraceae bacterium TWA4]
MSEYSSACEQARTMKSFEDIDCPKCHAHEAIEAVIMDGLTVGDSICDECGYVIPEGTNHKELAIIEMMAS